MTHGERLVAISKLSGVSAAVHLRALALGTTAGSTLVTYSHLATGTATVHLLVDLSTRGFWLINKRRRRS